MIDASLLIEVLLRPGPPRARIIGNDLGAPHLIDLEVASALRHRVAGGSLDADTARGLLEIDAHFEISRYPHSGLLDRAWELRHNLSIYDASYVALAEALDVPLATCDSAFATAPGVRCRVEVVPVGG